METNTQAAKGRAILNAKSKYPAFNPLDYDISLARNLSYYNLEVDNKLKREWSIAYWKKQNKSIVGFARVTDGYFSTVGAIVHMLTVREIELSTQHMTYIDRKYQEILQISKSNIILDVDSPEEIERAKNEKMLAEFKTHLSEFDYGMDLFFEGKSFDAKAYLIRNNVKPIMMKAIAEYYKPELKFILSISDSKDEQIIESYSFLTRRQLTKYAAHVQTMISACEVATAIIKAAKKPRAKKAKNPSEIVKNVKFLIEDTSIKLQSENPSSIIDSTEVWLYNSKIRRIFKYVALPGLKLTVKGTTIINVDVDKSGGKIIRKPETQLSGVKLLNSRQLSKIYSDIKGTESRGAGRLNEDTLIVRCFK